MKIGPFDTKPVPTPAASERKASVATTASVETSAKVALSTTASGLNNAGKADFDEAKVKRVAQAIREGKYLVNPDAIMNKLIASAQELLPKSH